MSKNQHEFWLIFLSFALVYFVWGSTYLANAWGVEVVPPFLFAGVRFILSGLILLVIICSFERYAVTRKQFWNTAFAGFMLFTLGNGLVVWALQYVDTSLTALIVAVEPLIVALMLWIFKSKRPQQKTWLGIFLGITGMFLLVGQPELATSTKWVFGVLAIFGGIIAWGYIAIWIPDADMPKSIGQSAALQMLWGGFSMIVISFVLQEYQDFQYERINTKVVWSFVYLVIFGSILTFTAYNYLLNKVSPTKVVASTYINPIVALFLGWWLNNELLTNQSLVAASILLVGVVFINQAKS